jgi:uncharacterized protein YndB with AHSA1/START domain
MPNATIAAEQDAIVSEIHVAAPPERVFKALTDAGELSQWFRSPECPVKLWEMNPRLDGAYRYATQKGSIVVNGVSEFECHGHITEFDPPRVLAYTWYANWHDDSTRRTLVRWELTAREGGTDVRVTHSGLANLPIARTDYEGGWPEVVENLKSFIEH